MAARLGWVVHWFCVVVAGLLALLFAVLLLAGDPAGHPVGFVVLLFAILVIYLVGRAVRFVLAGV